ncbi:hypothetical protein JR316_0001680 [Psilocybe cubensis]|uniref:Uncharacterized protein n=2 Tax=Psilocybe cubensis TaxID=181762 RepID=A0A8H7Y3L3_PSICU|nr:hypothetical protein JR316_0001680 [Psilocybe cubensis]KAH9484778.1 hypothetical protein JR316_0001680 [Psilocybe cubensis]
MSANDIQALGEIGPVLQELNETLPVFVCVVRGPLNEIINDYRAYGADCFVRITEAGLAQFLEERDQAGDVHFRKTVSNDDNNSVGGLLPFLVVLRGTINGVLQKSELFKIEHVLSMPKKSVDAFLDSQRTAGSLHLVPAADPSPFSASSHLLRSGEIRYTQWPAFGHLGPATTRIRRRRPKVPPVPKPDSDSDSDSVIVIRSKQLNRQSTSTQLRTPTSLSEVGTPTLRRSKRIQELSVAPSLRMTTSSLRQRTVLSTPLSSHRSKRTQDPPSTPLRRSQRLQAYAVEQSCRLPDFIVTAPTCDIEYFNELDNIVDYYNPVACNFHPAVLERIGKATLELDKVSVGVSWKA